VVELKREVCDAAKNATVLETRLQNSELEAAPASRTAEHALEVLREERDAARSEVQNLKMELSRVRGLENQVQSSVEPDGSIDLEMCT
jgi:predicted  nucleic acid-binding Zn-ribbon protein